MKTDKFFPRFSIGSNVRFAPHNRGVIVSLSYDLYNSSIIWVTIKSNRGGKLHIVDFDLLKRIN